jgi:hypothetical protein
VQCQRWLAYKVPRFHMQNAATHPTPQSTGKKLVESARTRA